MAWPLILGMASSIAGNAAAGNAANQSTEAAAEAQLNATRRNIALQKWISDQEQARLQPFMEQGTGALPELEQRRLGTFDTMASPYAQSRLEMLQSAMAQQQALRGGGDASYGMRNALQGLRADEEGLGYERALDRVRIGQGNAAQSGAQYGQYANALSGAYQQAGNINSALAQSLANQRSQLYGDTANTLAGYPAANYLYNKRRELDNNQSGGPLRGVSEYKPLSFGY